MREDGAPEAAGGRIEAWIFLGIGTFVFLVSVGYAVTSGEEAGATMLLLTAGLGALTGGYLLVQARRAPEPARVGGNRQVPDETYLPHASVWPLGVGVGCVVMVNGLALGAWAFVPGALLALVSVWGYARQSRRRD